MEKKFGPVVTNAMKYYVYGLVNPEVTDSLRKNFFYIGKGRENRAFDHLEEKISELSKESPTMTRIKELRRCGSEPEISIIAHGLQESEALHLEAVLIRALDGLTNIVDGHSGRDYCLSTKEIQERYDQPIPIEELEGPILFVSLHGKRVQGKQIVPAYPEIKNNEVELQRRTLGDWTIGDRNSAKVRFVVGCYGQLARCVYRVDDTTIERIAAKKPNGKSRSRWVDGERDSKIENRIAERTVIRSSAKILTTFGRQPWNFSN